MDLTNPDSIRHVAAKMMIRQAGSEDIKSMPDYTQALDMAVNAGKAVLNADPTVGEGPVRSAISEAIREPLQACRSEIIRRDKARRAAEQEASLQRQAAMAADEESQRPDAELASLLPGMPDTVSTLAGHGLATVRELLALAEEAGMLNLVGLGLAYKDSQTLIEALYTAKYDVSRLKIERADTPETPGTPTSDKPQPPKTTPEHDTPPSPGSAGDPTIERSVPDTPEASDAEPPSHPSPELQPAEPDKTDQPPADVFDPGDVPDPSDESHADPGPAPGTLAHEDRLPKRITDKLAGNRIHTREQLLDYIERHNGNLDTLNGIGDKSIAEITAYLETFNPA